jgi:hypothetical protein
VEGEGNCLGNEAGITRMHSRHVESVGIQAAGPAKEGVVNMIPTVAFKELKQKPDSQRACLFSCKEHHENSIE